MRIGWIVKRKVSHVKIHINLLKLSLIVFRLFISPLSRSRI